jgi:hypothetical protein
MPTAIASVPTMAVGAQLAGKLAAPYSTGQLYQVVDQVL